MTRVWSCLPDSFPLVCGGARWCAGQAANAHLEPTRVDIGEHAGLAGCGAPGSTPVAGRAGFGSRRPLTWFSQVRILPPPFLGSRWSCPVSPLSEPRIGVGASVRPGHERRWRAGTSRPVRSRSGGSRGAERSEVGGLGS